MHHLPGNPDTLRRSADEVARFGSLAESARRSISVAKAQLPAAGDSTAITQFAVVMQSHDAKLESLSKNASACASVLRKLAEQLDDLEDEASRSNAALTYGLGIPPAPQRLVFPAGLSTGADDLTALRLQALAHRQRAATMIDSLLPKGEVRRLVTKDPEPSTIQNIWDNTIGELLSAAGGIGLGLWDVTLGFLFTPTESGQRRDQTWRLLNALERAIAHDEYPDGRKGARKEVVDALGENLVRKDLLDKDPAAWFVAFGLDVALMFVGGAGLVKKGPVLLEKLGVKSTTLLRVAELSKLAKDSERFLSPTQRLIAGLSPRLAEITETALTKMPGVWERAVMGYAGRGRMVEDIVFEAIQGKYPNLYQLAYNARAIDIATDFSGRRIVSVKSLDLAATSYADNPAQVASTLRKYATELRDWGEPFARNPETGDITEWIGRDAHNLARDLYVGIPSDGISEGQIRAIEGVLTEFCGSMRKDPMKPSVSIHLIEVAR